MHSKTDRHLTKEVHPAMQNCGMTHQQNNAWYTGKHTVIVAS